MQFTRYDCAPAFCEDVLDILLEKEAENNLPISVLTENRAQHASGWFMGTIADNEGIILVALCAKPFDLFLHEAQADKPDAVDLLAQELHNLGFDPPGVCAESGLTQRFAQAYNGGEARTRTPMVVMRLDRLNAHDKAPGRCRTLDERDLAFVPHWELAFSEERSVQAFSIAENEERIRTRLGKDTHFIWEDGEPVSQAVHGRNTPNGAVITWVYTPPCYRGRGYATSIVAELSRAMLESGKLFCCLFADADNPLSRKIYRNLGYYDVCDFEDIRF